MPVYEYECESCRKVIEIWQGISDIPMTTCPECQGNLKKIISMSSFQLKGGGWYADGYSSTSCGTKSTCAKTSDNSPAACPNKAKGCSSC